MFQFFSHTPCIPWVHPRVAMSSIRLIPVALWAARRSVWVCLGDGERTKGTMHTMQRSMSARLFTPVICSDKSESGSLCQMQLAGGCGKVCGKSKAAVSPPENITPTIHAIETLSVLRIDGFQSKVTHWWERGEKIFFSAEFFPWNLMIQRSDHGRGEHGRSWIDAFADNGNNCPRSIGLYPILLLLLTLLCPDINW